MGGETAALFIFLTLGLTVALAILWVSNQKPVPVTPLVVRTIAVLPLKTMGNDSAEDYLGVGMADALITKLGNLNRVIVRPTSAVLKYSGAKQDALAAELDCVGPKSTFGGKDARESTPSAERR